MIEGVILSTIESTLNVVSRVIMAILIDWWRKAQVRHMEQTLTYEDVNIKASSEGLIPQITLSWKIKNRSFVNVAVTRIAGELYVGAWRLLSFDSDNLVEGHFGYTWIPLITITKQVLKKKTGTTEVKITLFPPIEFWLMDTYRCALYNTQVYIKSSIATAVIRVSKDDLTVETAAQVATSYRDQLSNRIRLIGAK